MAYLLPTIAGLFYLRPNIPELAEPKEFARNGRATKINRIRHKEHIYLALTIISLIASLAIFGICIALAAPSTWTKGLSIVGNITGSLIASLFFAALTAGTSYKLYLHYKKAEKRLINQ